MNGELLERAEEFMTKNHHINEIRLVDHDGSTVHLVRNTPVPYITQSYPWQYVPTVQY